MLRLTGGEFRGRMIATPKDEMTRPTQSKLRQALFNSLQSCIVDAKVLDLFAGSGCLGFEALSRGAKKIIFVEKARSVQSLIEKNAIDLNISERIRMIGEDVEQAISKLLVEAPFDLILADPPYQSGWEKKILFKFPWLNLLAQGGFLCLEWSPQKQSDFELPLKIHSLVKVREKDYGHSRLTTYQRVD